MTILPGRMVGLALALGLLLLACGGGGQPSVQTGDGGVVIMPVEATATPVAGLPSAIDSPDRPREGRWIEIDVTRFEVRLMDGNSVLQTIGPIAVGVAIDTGEYESTQTGLFHVYVKTEGLAYDPPYDTYISHWIGFDAEKDNGFHSFLKAEDGSVVDASTGRVSNGCIRTGEPEAIFAFAEIGMPVFVHT
jgi:hypothetical protein